MYTRVQCGVIKIRLDLGMKVNSYCSKYMVSRNARVREKFQMNAKKKRERENMEGGRREEEKGRRVGIHSRERGRAGEDILPFCLSYVFSIFYLLFQGALHQSLRSFILLFTSNLSDTQLSSLGLF